jgi:predicted molibdopterin-dependent oxidoreductase YjgC
MKPTGTISLEIDGMVVNAAAGDTIATVLLAHGVQVFGYDERHQPRGIFCGMGVCFDCLVTVDGIADVRACMTLAEEGMRISTGTIRYE